jgi:hypothetical protein
VPDRAIPRPAADELADASRGAMIVVMTQSHAIDSDITTAAPRRV